LFAEDRIQVLPRASLQHLEAAAHELRLGGGVARLHRGHPDADHTLKLSVQTVILELLELLHYHRLLKYEPIDHDLSTLQ